MSDNLTIADLKKLYLVTFGARIKWRNILLILDVPLATIDSIGKQWSDNPDECYREGLREWLNEGGKSWEDMVEALSSDIVGHVHIARTIEKDHVQSDCHQKINEDLTVFLDEPLGKGAFGVVFKGSYMGEICAVKVLLHDAMEMQASIPVGKNEEASNAIDCESDFLKSFQHPNVVQFLSTAKHPKSGSTILVLELMDCNLRSYFSGLGEESLTSECEISLSKDMACGLAYIHSKKIIHRDLCGDNILLKLTQPVPVAKISDFGMSRLYDSSKVTHTLTSIGHRMGYLPLEALRLEEEKYDSSLDVFSYGVILVQIVCKLETIKSAKDRSFYVAQIPHTHRLRNLIDSCLQEDMRRRPSAKDICDADLTRGSDTVEVAKKESKDTQPVNKSPPPRELRPPLTLKWRRGKDMPIKMGGAVQSVVIGDTVYVGGGYADVSLDDNLADRDECTVMKLEQDQWTKLLVYSAKWFAMTSFANQLVLVGGSEPETSKPTNQLAVFQAGKLTRPYPPMNIARFSSTAVSFNNHIIVAGGSEKGHFSSSVEMLDVASKRWYIAQSLPNPRSVLKSTLIGDTLYLMGGVDHTGATKTVHHVDLNELVSNALCNTKSVHNVNLKELVAMALSNPDTPALLWQTLKEVPLEYSAPLRMGTSLLAVGGRDDRSNPSSLIHLYQPDARMWVKVGDLPTARYGCTCSVLSSGELIVAGGQIELFSDHLQTVDLISY